MKKLIAFIFAALFAAGAWANQYEATVDGVTWYFNLIDDGNGGYNAEITYRGSYASQYSNVYSGSLTIPSTLGGYSVTTIGNCAFIDCSSLISITIPDSVTTIGSSAFYGTPFYNNQPDGLVILGNGCLYKYKGNCPSSVTIPDSVTTIGSNAFADCSSLTSVTIPDSVTTIGSGAFSYCSSLTSVTIPNSVTEIGSEAFRGCSSLTSITIPNSVTTIGSGAFSDCSSLTSITIPNSVTTIGSSAFEYCSSLKSVTIPNSATTIGKRAFYYCSSLASITIPDGVTSIGDSAFYYCSSLASITIPDGVTSIGDYAFYRCSSLTTITIPDSVTTIGAGVFSDCSSRMEFIVGDNNPRFRSINKMLCSKDGKTVLLGVNGDVKIPDCVTSIGRSAFDGCNSLTSVTIPDSVTAIGSDAFSYCSSLTSVTIPDSVTAIGPGAFYYCSSLASITIPYGVTSIGDYAFYYCRSLTSITIPNSVTTIGLCAFDGCSSLTTINIPSCLHEIGGSAFKGCRGLADASGLVIVNGVLFDYIGDGSVLEITSNVAVIDGNALSGVKHIQHLIIGGNVKEFKDGAFSYTVIDVLETNYPEQVRQAVGNAENASPFNKAQQIVVMDEDVSALSFTVKYKSSHDCDMCDDNGYWCEEYVEKDVKYGHTAYSPQVMCYVPWMEFSHWEPSISCVTGDIETSPILKKRNFNEFLLSDVWQWGSISGDLFEITDAFYDVSNACYRVQGTVNPELRNLMQSFDNYSSEQDTWSAKIVGYDITNQRANEAVGAVFYFGETLYWSCVLTEYDNLDHLEIEFSYSLFEDSYTIWLDIPEETREIRVHDIPRGEYEFRDRVQNSYYGTSYESYTNNYNSPEYIGVKSGDVLRISYKTVFQNIVRDPHNYYWDRSQENVYYNLDGSSIDIYSFDWNSWTVDEKVQTFEFITPCAEEWRVRQNREIDLICNIWYSSDYHSDRYTQRIVIDPDIYTYTVEFLTGENWSYSSGDDLSYIVDEGDVVPHAPNVIVKDGWHFVGWDRDLEEPIMTNTIVRPICAPNTYTITYANYPAALGYELPETYSYNEDCALPEIADYSFGSELPDGTRASTFRFDGWTINGEKVDKIPAGTIGDVVVKFNSTLLVNFGDTEGPQPMPRFSHDTTVAWKGAAPTPKVMVTVEGRGELVEGQDFTVEYVDNDKVGTAKVIVRGKGDYIGTYTGSFLITKGSVVAEDTRKDIFAWSPSSAAFAYDGTEKSISTIIAEDVDEIDVEVTGTTSAVNAGAYSAKAKGTIKRFASDDYYNYTYVTTVDSTKTLTITARDLSDFSAALSQDVFFYDGAAKYPSVSITDEGLGVELKNGKDYNVSYLNNAQIGEASLTITGCGNYKGMITRQFTILDRLENLPKISITPESKVVNGRATITMTYSGIAGYETEVRYTTDGSEPTKDSSKYEKRFAYVVSADTTIKAAAFLRGVRVSEVASERYLPSVNAAIVQTGEGCGPVEVQTSGAAPWLLDVEELGEDGTPSMKSGKIGNNGESIMTATFEGDGVFEFWWKTSCEYDDLEEFFCDHVECWLDGEVYTQADGETPWTKVVVSVTTKGSHTITWKYVKDDADDAEYPGDDCAWVDGVKFSFAAYVDFAADEEIVGTLPERVVSSAGYEIELPELGEVTYERHVFAGWKYGDKIYLPGEKLTVDAQDMVVKPIWTEVLEVSFDLNGGNGNVPVTQQVISGGSVNLAGIGEASLAKHSFGGWSLNGNVYAAGTGFVPQSDVQFTAVWIAKTLNMPIISVATEHDEPTTVVKITAIDDEVTIYYTIDGSDPSEENGTRYEGAFEVAGSVTIKAIAIKEDYFDSEVEEATVVSTYTPMSVGFVGGEGVVGTMPSAIETALRREIELPEIGEARLPKHSFAGWTDGTQVYQPGDKYSIAGEVSFAAVWTEKILSSPKIEVAEWYDTEKTEVVITCDNEDAVIYYTIDGTEPSSSSLKYEDGFEVEGSLTIKAIAIAEDWFDSEVVEKSTVRAPWTINEILESELEFTTGGDAAWKRDLVDGKYVMRSGVIGDDAQSWLQATLPSGGKLSFEWKVSCESLINKGKEYAVDYANFSNDETEIDFFGEKSWTKVEMDVAKGNATWMYIKDESDSNGEDCVWIRNVVWTPAATRPSALEHVAEKIKEAFDEWVKKHGVSNPSAANVNAFILGLAPDATEEAIQEQVEAEIENIDMSKLATDPAEAVEAIQAKYPNAKVELAPVEGLKTSAHLYKLVIELK
ncbi:MAG: leucine-rich repeat protein [Kiritimatiellae bacterium]|nr:leucine-rich repeat protein [Kiritimatiellia bacterium]